MIKKMKLQQLKLVISSSFRHLLTQVVLRFIAIKEAFLKIPVVIVFLKMFRKPKIAALFLGGLILISFIVLSHRQTDTPSVPDFSYVESQVLTVVDIEPDKYSDSYPEEIKIRFSDEVDIHQFEHYFSISPGVQGKVKIGLDSREMIFKPDQSFPKGVNFSIRIEQGLASKNNKPLLSSYYNDFTTNPAKNQVQFISNNLSGRVLSFPGHQPVNFRVKNNARIKTINVNIYKSTENKLLEFLTYELVQKDYQDNQNSKTIFQYNHITHDVKALVQSTEVSSSDKEISLSLAPGIYYVEANDLDQQVRGSLFLLVNNTGVSFRQDDQKIVLATFDLKDGRQIQSETDVDFYELLNSPKKIISYKVSGLRALTFPIDKKLDVILARVNDEILLVPVRLPQSQAEIKSVVDLEKTAKIFLYTDRPIYKPQDKVYFRGVARKDSDTNYEILANTPIRIGVGGSNDKLTQIVKTDQYGIFHGEIILPKEFKEKSEYADIKYLYASTNLNPSNYIYATSANFEVKQYIKPEFSLDVNRFAEETTKGEKIRFSIKGSYFDGKPLANKEISYSFFSENFYETEKTVYNKNFNLNSQGGMCGGGFDPFTEYYGERIEEDHRLILDQKGTAEVTFDTSQIKKYFGQKITLLAKQLDGLNNNIMSAASTIVHASDINIFFTPSTSRYTEGEELVAPFYAESPGGEKIVNKQFNYRLVEQLYLGQKSDEKSYISGQVSTDNKGKGIIKFNLPPTVKDKGLSLIVDTTDNSGNKSENQKNVFIASKDTQNQLSYFEKIDNSQTYLKIVSNQNSFKTGDNIFLTLTTPRDVDALMTLERGRIYNPQVMHLSKGENIINIPVSSNLSPSIAVVFTFFENGIYHSEGLSLNTPAMHKLLTVNVSTDKAQYVPNDTAKIRINILDSSNTPISAPFSLSVVDKGIYTLRKSATPPFHSTFYAFRPRTTNSSSSLTGVGSYNYGGRGGGGGGGGLPTGKDADTLFWNPSLTTDASGEALVPVPLKGLETTWKAQVYASSNDSKIGQGETEFIAAY